MNIVLDTNVLVSALWSPGRKATDILNAVFAGRFTVCCDHRIVEEYDRVLHYKKFPFTEREIDSILELIIYSGISVVADPLPDADFTDESDRKFYEVARYCDAVLITGNGRHFPQETNILSITDFCEMYM